MSFSYPNIKIVYNNIDYEVVKIYVTELNFIMLRLYSEEKKVFFTYNLGKYNSNKNFIVDAIRKNN